MLGDGGTSTRSAPRIRRAVVALVIAAGGLLPAVPAAHAAPDETSTTAAAAPETTTTTVESSTTTTTSTTTTVPVTAAPTASPVVTPPPTAPPAVTPNAAPQQIIAAATCSISIVVQQGTRGAEALCAEQTLAALGLRFIGPDDTFGVSTANALKQWQASNGLAADGIVGQATGTRLGIWVPSTAPAPPPPTPPTTPPPPPPPPAEALPANSGSGRRVVYSRPAQRVWAVEADGTVVKTHRVSGRLREPYAGTYQVYSRSMYTYSTENPDVKWRYMVRFAYGPGGGRIGFHEIPKRFGVPLQSEAQLGQPLSGGCVRQKTSDAQWMWDWAGVGTKVVVL